MMRHAKKILSLTLVLILSMLPQVFVSAATIITIKGTTKTTNSIVVDNIESFNDIYNLDTLPFYQVELPADTKEVTIPLTITKKGVLDLFMYHDLLDTYESPDSTQTEAATGDSLTYYDADQYDFNYDEYEATLAKVPQNDILYNLYSDEACTKLVAQATEKCSDGEYESTFVIPNAGTYYVKITMVGSYTGTEQLLYDISAMEYSAEDRNLANNDITLGSSINQKPIYYKVKVSTDGYFNLFTSDYSASLTENEININLCDANKKVITKTINMNDYDGTAIYAVKKGTYYISISTTTTDPFCLYALGYTFVNVSDNSGTKKSTAKKLTTGKIVTGLQTLQKNSADWYKITVSKNSKMTIELQKSMTTGSIQLDLYDKNNKKLTYYAYEKDNKVTYTTSSKLKPGTYYIKLNKSSQYASGYYTLNVK